MTPNLVSRAGLVPVMALAERAGLSALAAEHVRIARRGGVNARVKVPGIVAGMAGGADSIDDLDLLRHGALPALFGGVRAPAALGSFLRSFTWGNVLQLGKVHRLVLAELARCAPLLPGRETLAFVDIDAQQKRVYGRQKQGAAFGHTKIQGKSLLVRGGECAGRHGQHAAGRAGDRGHQAARRQCRVGPGCRVVRHRRGARRPRHRVPRDRRGAGRLGVLLGGFRPGGAGGRGVRLGHRADEPPCAGGDRGHRRGGLEAHPVSPGDLG
jgi:hypothetical protein